MHCVCEDSLRDRLREVEAEATEVAYLLGLQDSPLGYSHRLMPNELGLVSRQATTMLHKTGDALLLLQSRCAALEASKVWPHPRLHL